MSETVCLCTAATVDKTEEVGCESGGLLLEMRKKSKKKKKVFIIAWICKYC